jgi:hypothetical protein
LETLLEIHYFLQQKNPTGNPEGSLNVPRVGLNYFAILPKKARFENHKRKHIALFQKKSELHF